MEPYILLALGVFIGTLGFFLKSWIEGVNKRLDAGNKKFSDVERRLTILETRQQVEQEEGDRR